MTKNAARDGLDNHFFNSASRCLTSLSSSSVCCAIRSAFRASSSAPENAVACSTSCRMLSRIIAMRCSSSRSESELPLLMMFCPNQTLTRRSKSKKTTSLMHLPDGNRDRSDQGMVEDRLTHMITPQIKDRFRWPGLLKYAKTRKSDWHGRAAPHQSAKIAHRSDDPPIRERQSAVLGLRRGQGFRSSSLMTITVPFNAL